MDLITFLLHLKIPIAFEYGLRLDLERSRTMALTVNAICAFQTEMVVLDSCQKNHFYKTENKLKDVCPYGKGRIALGKHL